MADEQKPATHHTPSAREIAAELRATRRELAATVEALAHRSDAATKLRGASVRWRMRAHEQFNTAKLRAGRFMHRD